MVEEECNKAEDYQKSSEQNAKQCSSSELSHSFSRRTWIILIVSIMLLTVVVDSSFLKGFNIVSSSMYPTLLTGDRVLVNKSLYSLKLPFLNYELLRFSGPKRGDVVVFWGPDYRAGDVPPEGKFFHYVKRVVGVPGDNIEVKGDKTFVNGFETYETRFIAVDKDRHSDTESLSRNFGPITLSADEYFVLGDNRVYSQDSRFFGPIKRSAIEGRALFIYWSWGRLRQKIGKRGVRWPRVGRWIR